jgi:hypothetical protein
MATLTINFQANTSGDHYVGYREIHMDPVGVFTVITVNCPTPGNYDAIIPIEGSLYCGPLHFAGYLVADCQDLETGIDGYPFGSIQWTQDMAEQLDPCVQTELCCEFLPVPIEDLPVAFGGLSYSLGDILPFVESNPGDEILPGDAIVTAVDGSGAITGARVNISGLWKDIPTVDATVHGDGLAIIPPPIALSPCPSVNLVNVVCLTVNDKGSDYGNQWNPAKGECITLCAKADLVAVEAEVGPSYEVTQEGNCKCKGCETIQFTTSGATSGSLTVSYNKCWDRGSGETLVIVDIPHGVVSDPECMIFGTYTELENTLSPPAFGITYGACSPNL